MRLVTRHQRHRRRPLAQAAAGVLALVCVVQLHLLLRRSSLHSTASLPGGAADSAGGTAAFGGAAQRQQQQQQTQQQQTQQQQQQQAGRQRDEPQQQQQRPADGTQLEEAASGLSALRGAPLAMVSFANGAFTDFISNWVLSVQRIKVPFLVGCLDAPMVQVARQKGWPHLDVSALVAGNSTFFRANFEAFRNMGATKVQLVKTVLEELGVQMVVVSDSDTSWVKDPSPYLAQHPTADWFISTDCLSAEVEEAWQPRHFQPRCGHVTGNTWGRAFNTGVFAVRNRAAGLHLLDLWRELLLDPQRQTAITKTNVVLGVTDQLALNMLLEEGLQVTRSPPDAPRLLLLRNDTLRLHPLPVALFPSGHVAFVQRSPWRNGGEPYVVHATFQRYPTLLAQAGKRARFREFGLWHLDGPEYYAPPRASYLAYDNDVREVVAAVAAQRYPPAGAMPPFYKHLIAASYQLALFRDALAAARMLGRTLVLPTSWCWCDYDWTPHVLERCKIRGTDTRLPFKCPADFIFHIPYMDLAAPALDYRPPGFLEQPQVPAGVRLSAAEVEVSPQAPGGSLGASPALWPRMSERQLADSLAKLQGTSVVRIKGMRPGLVEGFTDPQRQAEFDTLFTNVTRELYWCCSGQGAGEMGGWPYQLPAPFARGYTPWQAPTLTVPRWCDKAEADPRNREFALYANHPCQFLRNSTAAAIAGAIERRRSR